MRPPRRGAGARLAIPGGKLGILLSPRNIWRLAQLVGQGTARDFLLAGRTVDADEALRLGLVQRIVDDALSDALRIAAEIAAAAPLTVQGHKRALNLVAEAAWSSSDERVEIEALEARAFASEDLQEGMAAFAEKRNPDFKVADAHPPTTLGSRLADTSQPAASSLEPRAHGDARGDVLAALKLF